MLCTVLRVAGLRWLEIVSRLSQNVTMLNATNLYGGITRETLSGSSSDHFPSLNVFHFLFGYVLGYTGYYILT
jgi:hypothetical protein